MVFQSSPTRLLAAGMAAALLLAAPASADVKLLMFQQQGCPWCAKWNAQIAPAYPKTSEGKEAPLERLDIHDPLPAGLSIKGMPQFTPTFVLVENGKELGRIVGYPGANFFWPLLDQLLKKILPEPAAPQAAAIPAPAKT